jgi:hypothetical protein
LGPKPQECGKVLSSQVSTGTHLLHSTRGRHGSQNPHHSKSLRSGEGPQRAEAPKLLPNWEWYAGIHHGVTLSCTGRAPRPTLGSELPLGFLLPTLLCTMILILTAAKGESLSQEPVCGLHPGSPPGRQEERPHSRRNLEAPSLLAWESRRLSVEEECLVPIPMNHLQEGQPGACYLL